MQLIQLDSPYYTMRQDGLAAYYFAKMLKLRVKGFVKHHGDKALPFGKDDIIADHLMIEDNGVLVGKYKAIPLKRCIEFGIELPILPAILEKDYREKTRQYLEERSDKNIYYMGTFTEVVLDRRKRRLVRNLISLSAKKYFEDKKIDEIIVSASKQSYKFFCQLGFEKLFDNAVDWAGLNGSVLHIMSLKEFAPEILKIADELLYYWENRVVIDIEKMDEQSQNQNDIGNNHLQKTGS